VTLVGRDFLLDRNEWKRLEHRLTQARARVPLDDYDVERVLDRAAARAALDAARAARAAALPAPDGRTAVVEGALPSPVSTRPSP